MRNVEVSFISQTVRVEDTTQKKYYYFAVDYTAPTGEKYYSPRNKIYKATAPTEAECRTAFIKEKIEYAKGIVDFWKALSVVVVLLFTSVGVSAQVDTSIVINTEANVSRCVCLSDTIFGQELKMFRIKHNVAMGEMQAMISSIATYTLGYTVWYSQDELLRIEVGTYTLFPAVQTAIENVLARY